MMDPEAEFRRLYAEHRAAVHAYFTARTADRWLAADLMQEVFVRVWQRLPELVGKSADGQRAWVFTVTRNLAIDSHRHQRSRASADRALRNEPVAPQPPAAAAVIDAERVAVVAQAISKLPERQRTTLAMAAAGDLTSADIATALGVPAGTIRYRLSQARRTLAAALDSYEHPPTRTAP
jgi:RNA polymerase sigma-70 factor (ECF subfamily)